MSDDVLARAKAALDEYGRTEPNIYTLERYRELTLQLCLLAPELVAEVEKLRATLARLALLGGPR